MWQQMNIGSHSTASSDLGQALGKPEALTGREKLRNCSLSSEKRL